MFIKIIGACLLIISGTMIGVELSKDYGDRLKQLIQLKKVMIILSGEIKYNNSNIKFAFEKIAKNSEEFIKKFLNEIVREMDKNPEREIGIIWRDSVDGILRQESKFKKNDMEELKEVGDFLGITDRENQLNNFNLYIEKLENSIKETENSKDTKCKLYRTIGMMFAMLIAITII